LTSYSLAAGDYLDEDTCVGLTAAGHYLLVMGVVYLFVNVKPPISRFYLFKISIYRSCVL